MKHLLSFSLFAAIVFSMTSFSFAQLSTREDQPTVLKLGTRPVTGNLGFVVSTSYQDIMNILDTTGTTFTGMPIIGFKYYYTDDIVIRISTRAFKKLYKESGTVDPLVNGGTMTSNTTEEISKEYVLKIGGEQHFLKSNLGDAYIGVDLVGGMTSDKDVSEQDYEGGDLLHTTSMARKFLYGLSGHFGLQAFIADLPLAVAFEVGFSAVGLAGNKYKHDVSTTISGTSTNQTYYTVNKDDITDIKYSKLDSRKSDLGFDARIGLCYYFTR